jgi:hypothetical protein
MSVQENIKKARRAAYSVIGTGMYGWNGIHPRISVKLWCTFVIPVLVSGLETLQLSLDDMETLERFQRQFIRCIMHLPKGTANSAVHLLTGLLPVQAVVEKRALVLFINMISEKDSKGDVYQGPTLQI